MTNPLVSGLRSRREALGLGAMSGVGVVFARRVLSAAGAMTFGPGNVLFVGDIAGSAVHAFALRDTDLTPQTGVELGNFHNFEGVTIVQGLDLKLAELLGTTYDSVIINDLVVHRPTQQIFLSVERGRGADV